MTVKCFISLGHNGLRSIEKLYEVRAVNGKVRLGKEKYDC
jgi:hypothetical protein